MAKVAFKPPNLSNSTPAMIVDELGKIKVIEGQLKKLKEFYKEALKARLDPGQNTIEGEAFISSITTADRTALDQEKAKAILESIGKLAECMSTTEVDTLRTDSKVGGKAIAVKDILAVVEYLFPEMAYQG